MIQREQYGEPYLDSTVIWRYMDVSRFLSLLTESTLYFPTVFQLADPYEGIEVQQGEFAAIFYRQAAEASKTMPIEDAALRLVAMGPEGHATRVAIVEAMKDRTDEENANIARVLPKQQSLLQQLHRSWSVVSCWHINNSQSAAMWELYCKSGEGIAIRSTVGALCSSIHNYGKDLTVSTVKYRGVNEIVDGMALFRFAPSSVACLFQKRKSFEHEHELRIVQQNETNDDETIIDTVSKWESLFHADQAKGIEGRVKDVCGKYKEGRGRAIPVNLDVLIDEIYVAPLAGGWIKPAIEKVLETLKPPIRKKVNQSDLYKDPL